MTFRSNVICGIFVLAIAIAGCHQTSSQISEPTPQSQPMVLENITWQLVDIGGKPAVPVPMEGKPVTFRLDSNEKRISGYTGVNQFNGPYQLDGQSLSFGVMAMTRAMGVPPFDKQEDALTQALHNTKSWRPAGVDTIELLDSAGKPLAKFTSK
ncbi:MAG TPA: META domain-containing protein [Tepidisphaeraceae bacterium]